MIRSDRLQAELHPPKQNSIEIPLGAHSIYATFVYY